MEDRPVKIRRLNGSETSEGAVDDGNKAELKQPEAKDDSTTKEPGSNNEEEPASGEFELYEPRAKSKPIVLHPETGQPISKNQQKKLKRQAKWDAEKEIRKVKRREKLRAKRMRDREQNTNSGPRKPAEMKRKYSVPVSIIIDCDFDDLMTDQERKSLAAQITRCYAANSQAPLRAHFGISSFGGELKSRFDNALYGHYKSWKGTHISEKDFVELAAESKEWMAPPRGGRLRGALEQAVSTSASDLPDNAPSNDGSVATVGSNAASTAMPENQEPGEVVYLSAESEEVLEGLKPNGTYIIGGLVDRNRYKNKCNQRALDRGIKTARLPIGEHMKLASRSTLVTNHVYEILLQWLELGDWGKAFLNVIPKRKGVALKKGSGAGDRKSDGEEDEQDFDDHELEFDEEVEGLVMQAEASVLPKQ